MSIEQEPTLKETNEQTNCEELESGEIDKEEMKKLRQNSVNFWESLPGGSRRVRFDSEWEIEPGDESGVNWGQFWSEIDNAINEIGLDRQKIEQLQDERQKIRNNPDSKRGDLTSKEDELFKYITPVYLEMRKKGYTNDQLCR